MSKFERVTQGAPVKWSARTVNALMRMAEEWERSHAGGAVPMAQGEEVLVKNDSGNDVTRFEFLGIDNVLYSPTDALESFKNRPVLVGKTPTTEDHTGKFIQCLDSIPNGRIGRGLLSGVTTAQVQVDDEDYASADVKDGEDGYLLAIDGGGAAQILWKPSGTGILWAVLRLGVPPVPFSIPCSEMCTTSDWQPDDHQTGEDALTQHQSSVASGTIFPETNYIRHIVGKFDRPFLFRNQSQIVVPVDDHPGAVEYLASVAAPSATGSGGRYVFEVLLNLKAILEDFDASSLTHNQYLALSKTVYGVTGAAMAEGGWGTFPSRTLYVGTDQQWPSGLVAKPYTIPGALLGHQVFGFGLEVAYWTAWLGGNVSYVTAHPHLHKDYCYALP